MLFLFVLKRWGASASSYQFVMAPFVAIGLSAVLAGEGVTPITAAGAALVLGGVYLGVLAQVRPVQ